MLSFCYLFDPASTVGILTQHGGRSNKMAAPKWLSQDRAANPLIWGVCYLPVASWLLGGLPPPPSGVLHGNVLAIRVNTMVKTPSMARTLLHDVMTSLNFVGMCRFFPCFSGVSCIFAPLGIFLDFV